MKSILQRRRFYPHASRKNRKRAQGTRQVSRNPTPARETLGGLGAELMRHLMRPAAHGRGD